MQDSSKQRQGASMKGLDSWLNKACHLVVKSIPMSREMMWNGGQIEVWESNRPASKSSLSPSLANYKPGALGKVASTPRALWNFRELMVWLKAFSPVQLWADKKYSRWAGFPSRCFISKTSVTQFRLMTQQGDAAGWNYLKDVQARGVTSSEVRSLSGWSRKRQQFKEDGIWPKLCQV